MYGARCGWLAGLLLALEFGIGIHAPRSALAFRCRTSDDAGYVSIHWDRREIAYAVPDDTPVERLSAIDAAFLAWTEPECTDLVLTRVSSGSSSRGGESVARVVFVTQGWVASPEVVATTRTIYGTGSGLIGSAAIEVNEELFALGDATQDCEEDGPVYDLAAVLTHEVGHLLGLDHAARFLGPAPPTMSPEVAACETDKRTLEADDVEGLCQLYPAGGPDGTCKPFPAQERSYVESRALSCSAGTPERPRSGIGPLVSVIGALLVCSMRRSLRRRGSPMLLALLFLGSCGAREEETTECGPRCTESPRRVYVGMVEGSDAAVGVVEREGALVLYVCGGPETLESLTGWYGDVIRDDAFSMEAEGKRVTGRLEEDRASGTLAFPDGRTFDWVASIAAPRDGLPTNVYRARQAGALCNSGGLVLARGAGVDPFFQGTSCDDGGAPLSVSPILPLSPTDAGIEVLVPKRTGPERLLLPPVLGTGL